MKRPGFGSQEGNGCGTHKLGHVALRKCLVLHPKWSLLSQPILLVRVSSHAGGAGHGQKGLVSCLEWGKACGPRSGLASGVEPCEIWVRQALAGKAWRSRLGAHAPAPIIPKGRASILREQHAHGIAMADSFQSAQAIARSELQRFFGMTGACDPPKGHGWDKENFPAPHHVDGIGRRPVMAPCRPAALPEASAALDDLYIHDDESDFALEEPRCGPG